MTAAALATFTIVNLMVFQLDLAGVLLAIFASCLLSAVSVAWQFGRRFRPTTNRLHVRASLDHATPIVAGLLAHFVSNRMSPLILQHSVSVEQNAVFGLAQQVDTLVGNASAALGKASKPAVFGAAPEEAHNLLLRASRAYIGVVFAITCIVLIFALDIIAWAAPRRYWGRHEVVHLLANSAFVYSLRVISDAIRLDHRHLKTSAGVSTVGHLGGLVDSPESSRACTRICRVDRASKPMRF